jgi:predicted AAA+ superfamily ATPase
MDRLLLKSEKKINGISEKFHRYLFDKINLNNRLISILGARGTGKTTLLLQLAKQQNPLQVLYVALDDLFFYDSSLYGLAEQFSKLGGEILFLDEVHKYPDWSRELKLIYDDFEDLKVVFTSSSILDIYKGESDLSRRVLSYNLKEMSFREYLLFQENITLPILSLDDIIVNHSRILLEITKSFKPIKYFQKYLQIGAYPYYFGEKDEYYQRISNTINLILDVDVQSIEGIDYANIAKLKRLLFVLAENVPFTPNISKLSEKININRNLLIQALQILERAELIHTRIKTNKSVSILSKPDKIWLHNTNLSYVISSDKPNLGNLRETFFLQHLSVLHNLSLPKCGDFLVDNKYTFEIGGSNKSHKQIQSVENSFVVKDDIENGVLDIIPLWMFGLIY